jgi:hypothetical protein
VALDMLLGTNDLNNKPVLLSEKDRMSHIHIIGTTGAGKSKLMESMIRQDIDAGRGLCLIDPHGSDLYHGTLAYITRKRLKNRVIIIDPNDEEWAVGLNYLEYDPEVRSSTSHASEVMKGIAKVFGGEDTDTLPRLQRWERNALIPLIEKRLTLVELSGFVDPERSFLRKIVLEEFNRYEVLDEWERFDNAPKRDRETYIESILNRANKFAVSDVRRIFGQMTSTVNFRKAMDEGKIILCNLACGKLSQEEQKMLGIVIVDKITQAGKSRSNIPEERRRPFFFYLDEFQNFVSDDIARALQELRKFKVFFTLAHQELEQLMDDSKKVYSAVLAEPEIKISFRLSREDAEIMAREMFTGKIRGDQIKNMLKQTKFRPILDFIDIETFSESWSETDSESSSDGETSIPIQEPVILDEDSKLASIQSVSVSSRSSSSGGGYSTSRVPLYRYEEFKETSSIQYYSVEEMLEKFISWIKNQDNRFCQVKIKRKSPVPVLTPFVESLPVREKDVLAIKQESYSRYALPVHEVDKMLDERRADFLDQAVQMGYVEAKKETKNLTPENMRHK